MGEKDLGFRLEQRRDGTWWIVYPSGRGPKLKAGSDMVRLWLAMRYQQARAERLASTLAEVRAERDELLEVATA